MHRMLQENPDLLSELGELLGGDVSEVELDALMSVISSDEFAASIRRGLDDLKCGRKVPYKRRTPRGPTSEPTDKVAPGGEAEESASL